MPAHMRAMLQRMRAEVEKHCDYVGPQFAEEARKMHRGESDKRGIYGETSPEQAEALAEEGIEILAHSLGAARRRLIHRSPTVMAGLDPAIPALPLRQVHDRGEAALVPNASWVPSGLQASAETGPCPAARPAGCGTS